MRDVLHTSTRGCNSARRRSQARASVTVLVAVMHPSSDGGFRRCASRFVHPPLRRLVLREHPHPFRESLRRVTARKRLCGSIGCAAAQRYPRVSWTASSAPLRSSSAMLSDSPSPAAQCSGVSLHGRRWEPGRPAHRCRSGNGAPAAVLGVHPDPHETIPQSLDRRRHDQPDAARKPFILDQSRFRNHRMLNAFRPFGQQKRAGPFGPTLTIRFQVP